MQKKRYVRVLPAFLLLVALASSGSLPLSPVRAEGGEAGEPGSIVMVPVGYAGIVRTADGGIHLEKTVLSLSARGSRDLAGVPFDGTAVGAGIDRLEDRVRGVLRGNRDPRKVVAAIGKVLFREEGFAYDPSGTDVQLYLINRVLDRKKGNCLGLTMLYDILGDRLGVPLSGSYVPGHIFVRYEGNGVRINAETARKGAELSDADYRKLFRLGDTRPYLRTLTRTELVGVYLKTLGASCSREGRDDEALQLYTEAKLYYPELSDAYYNTGISFQRKGLSEEALAQYRRSLVLDPDLTVARDNLGKILKKLGRAEEGLPPAVAPAVAAAQDNAAGTSGIASAASPPPRPRAE